MYCTIPIIANKFSCWQLSTLAFRGCMSDMFPVAFVFQGSHSICYLERWDCVWHWQTLQLSIVFKF
jgi:hypothetical protein